MPPVFDKKPVNEEDEPMTDGTMVPPIGALRLPVSAYLILAILACAPAAFALTTFQEPYAYSPWRHYSLPILLAEAFIVIVAIASGFSVFGALRGLRKYTQIVVAVAVAAAGIATASAQYDPSAALALFLTFLLHGLVALALNDRLNGHWKNVRPLMLPALAVGLAAYVIIAVILAWSVKRPAEFSWVEFGAGVTHVRHLGYLGTALSGIAAGLLASTSRLRPSIAAALLLFFGLFLIGWSGSRGAFGAGIVLLIASLAICPSSRRQRFFLWASSVFVVAMPISGVLSPDPVFGIQSILGRLLPQWEQGVEVYTSKRSAIWADTWQHILQQPLLGHGDGQFRQIVTAAGGRLNHPHNVVLQFLFSWGLIGSLALAFLVAPTILGIPAALRHSFHSAMPAVGTIIGLASFSMLDGALYYPLPVLAFIIALVVVAASEGPPLAESYPRKR